MCETCGCGQDAKPRLTDLNKTGSAPSHEHSHVDAAGNTFTHSHAHENEHSHEHEHEHEHSHVDADGNSFTHIHAHAHEHRHEHKHGQFDSPASTPADAEKAKIVAIEKGLLSKNDALAARNRSCLAQHGIIAINLLSSPGAGKTTLLERSIKALKDELQLGVLEGDQETSRDAERIKASGCPVIQINTGTGCHLDASMVADGMQKLNPADNSLLFIENVGNLVCPALFDLGEKLKVVMLSVTEGEDKPLKYPHMFRAADILILNKIDLLPHLDFNLADCINNALAVNPDLRLFQLSASRGNGMDEWLQFLKQLIRPLPI